MIPAGGVTLALLRAKDAQTEITVETVSDEVTGRVLEVSDSTVTVEVVAAKTYRVINLHYVVSIWGPTDGD